MSIDLSQIISALSTGVFAVLGFVITGLVNSHLKDASARTVVDAAIGNSLGALQQAATTSLTAFHPSVALPASIPPDLQAGVQYVLANAGPEAARFGITPEAIAAKIDARIGLAKIQAAKVAAVTGPALPATVKV
jgi:hypothetical protein